jgi:uncharacterized membrane protein
LTVARVTVGKALHRHDDVVTTGEIVITALVGFVAAGFGTVLWAQLNHIKERLNSTATKDDVNAIRQETNALRHEVWQELRDTRSEVAPYSLRLHADRSCGWSAASSSVPGLSTSSGQQRPAELGRPVHHQPHPRADNYGGSRELQRRTPLLIAAVESKCKGHPA